MNKLDEKETAKLYALYGDLATPDLIAVKEYGEMCNCEACKQDLPVIHEILKRRMN